MKSHEQKFSEAIEALAYRLNSWGVTDPTTKAREFMLELTRHGWRGAFRDLDLPRERLALGDASSGAAACRAAAGLGGGR